MKIYTKTGDNGTTSLGNGERVSKSSMRVQTYGDVDELCSLVGLLRTLDKEKQHDANLLAIQKILMRLGGEVALSKVKTLDNNDIVFIERSIDDLQSRQAPFRKFVIPSGKPTTAQCHVIRCVCRRVERNIIALQATEPKYSHAICQTFLNRLSDYLFLLALSFCKPDEVEFVD
ncbi:MAG: cob(I)yrinic acid a,c-diamide adenosyltransferase [Bacteroidales bacterium]